MQKIILPLLFLAAGFFAPRIEAQEVNFAYQMAVIHTRETNPEKIFLKKTIKPAPSIVSEFEWLMDSLRNRCINPDRTLADTILGTWTTLKKNGIPMTLLDVARELTKHARNTNAFGTGKVNFRMTSTYWLTAKLAENITNPPKTKPLNYGVIK